MRYTKELNLPVAKYRFELGIPVNPAIRVDGSVSRIFKREIDLLVDFPTGTIRYEFKSVLELKKSKQLVGQLTKDLEQLLMRNPLAHQKADVLSWVFDGRKGIKESDAVRKLYEWASETRLKDIPAYPEYGKAIVERMVKISM